MGTHTRHASGPRHRSGVLLEAPAAAPRVTARVPIGRWASYTPRGQGGERLSNYLLLAKSDYNDVFVDEDQATKRVACRVSSSWAASSSTRCDGVGCHLGASTKMISTLTPGSPTSRSSQGGTALQNVQHYPIIVELNTTLLDRTHRQRRFAA